MPTVHILLATFNGEEFLAQQLASLAAQSEPAWTLLVMDDGSTDGTVAITEAAARSDPRIVQLPHPSPGSGSAAITFGELLARSLEQGADYIFCCDQDDTWHPDKIRAMLTELRAAEGEARTPALVHHDLVVVDRELVTRFDSFWSQMAIEPGTEADPQRLLSRNEVTGCALACNRSLLEIALPIPPGAIMHDWWLALCAAYFGRLRPLRTPLVRYRQHGRNTIGAKSFWHGLDPLTNWAAGWKRGDAEFLDTVRQAQAFYERMYPMLDPRDQPARALDLYRRLPVLGRWDRLAALRKTRVWRRHWLLDPVLALRMLLLPRETTR